MSLKVVSFNIRNCNDPNGNSVCERAPRLYKVLEPIKPDLIGFQEYKQHWKEHINKYFSHEYDMLINWRSSNYDEESVPILWRKDKFEKTSDGCFWLSDTPNVESRGWDEIYNCYRICSYVVLKDKVTQKTFTFLNTHFGFGDNGQVASSNLIADFSAKHKTDPIIITGDFNMTPNSPGYKKMVEYFVDVNTATVCNNMSTYHGYEPQKNTDLLIDYCFISKSVKPITYRVIDTLIDGKFPSDHFGILAEIEL